MDHRSDAADGLEAAARRPRAPAVVPASRCGLRRAIPEIAEHLFDGPRARRPEVCGAELGEALGVMVGQVLARVEPHVLGADEGVVAVLAQRAVLAAPHAV